MDGKKVYENLCWYDRRNPYTTLENDEPERPKGAKCSCDNCFYGRDVLALEIIRLRYALRRHT